MTRPLKAIAVTAVAAALLLTAGCASSEDEPTPSSTTAVTSDAPLASTVPPPPAGYTVVTAAANKIQVPLPSDLQVLDPSQMDINPDSQQTFAAMAQELGMTADDLKQQISTLDLYAIDTDTNNINILQPLPAIGTKLADVQPTLVDIGASDISSNEATCPTGPVLVVTYTLAGGDVPMNQTQLYAQTDTMTTTVITITGVTWTPDQVAQIAATMLAGLQHV